MTLLPRPVMPEFTASSTIYCMTGLSTIGNISFGNALVAGRNLVPKPAAGSTAFLIMVSAFFNFYNARFYALDSRDSDCKYVVLEFGVNLGCVNVFGKDD